MIFIENSKSVPRHPNGRDAGRSFYVTALLRALGFDRNTVQLVNGVIRVCCPSHDEYGILGRVVRDAVNGRSSVASELQQASVFHRCKIQTAENAVLDVVEQVPVQTVRRSLSFELENHHAAVMSLKNIVF